MLVLYSTCTVNITNPRMLCYKYFVVSIRTAQSFKDIITISLLVNGCAFTFKSKYLHK